MARCSSLRPSERCTKLFFQVLTFVHFLVVLGLVTGLIVEFARPPPFFDSFFDEHAGVPGVAYVFHKINPVVLDQSSQIHQLMDVPLLFIAVLYLGATIYLRFNFEAWALTIVASLNYLLYFVVNSWDTDFFQWRYFYYRGVGIALQLAGFAIVATFSITLVMRKRKRMIFHMKSPFNIPIGGVAHTVWNLIGQLMLYYLCLLMWISRSYQSYVCSQSEDNLNILCQMTEQVACIPCDTCSVEGFEECVLQHNRSSYQTGYCMSGIPYDKGFCIFNYSTGYFTFVKLFAYTGGLFFFSRNFFNALMHYTLLLVHSSVQWWRGNATERLEATWSSLSSRFSGGGGGGADRVNLRAYFRERIRRRSAPGVVTPPPPRNLQYQPCAAHSPILEASTEDGRDDEPGSHRRRDDDDGDLDEATPLVASSRSRGYGSGARPPAAQPRAAGGYALPSPDVQPPGVLPGDSREIDPLV